MLNASARFLDGIRASHTVLARATLYESDGTQHHYEIVDGDLKIDGRSNIRRQVTLSLMHENPDELTMIDVTNELVIQRGIRYFDQQVEWVTVGTFWVQDVEQEYPSQVAKVTAFDMGALVEDYRLITPYVPINNAGSKMNNFEAISDLLFIAAPGIPVNFDQGLDTGAVVPDGTVFTGSRWDAIQTMAKAMGAAVSASVTGNSWELRKIAVPELPSWTVDAGENGVLVAASSVRSRRDQFNAVPVRWETAEGGGLLFLTDASPNSPTKWGGPFGRKPADEVSLGTITSESEATAAAYALLNQYRGFARSLRFEAIVNPLLEPNDVVRVLMPDGTAEDHVIDSISYGLGAATMSCETRMVRTDNPLLLDTTGVRV